MTVQFRSHNGIWRIASTERLATGTTISVSRRNGQASNVVVGELLAHDATRDLPYLYAFTDARRAAGATPQEHHETIPDAERLFALFNRAMERGARAVNATEMRAPAVRFALSNTTRGLRLEMAGAGSRYAGQLLALTEQRTGRSRRGMYGALRLQGSFGIFTGRVGATQVELDIFNEVTTLLRNFAADPAGYSAAHGRQTGNCCYCGRGLTDARSLHVGYGPICADHYGLPWGDAPSFSVGEGSRRQLERLADNAGQPNAFDMLPPDRHDELSGLPLDEAAEDDSPQDTSLVRVERDPTDPNRLNVTLPHVENAPRRAGGVTRPSLQDEARAAGVPTLEDIQNEPNAMRRMAMAAQRHSAGLPPIASRNARGEIINRANHGIETATGEQLDAWGRQFNVARGIGGGGSDENFRRRILAEQTRIAASRNEAAITAAPGTPVPPAAGVVTNTYRRTTQAAAPVAPARSTRFQASAARAELERRARPAAPPVTDETTSQVVRAVRRDRNSPLEEDDFVWPPRQ